MPTFTEIFGYACVLAFVGWCAFKLLGFIVFKVLPMALVIALGFYVYLKFFHK